jgi:hypothetical protein
VNRRLGRDSDVKELRSRKPFRESPGLLDMRGRPLLYSPAFCRFDIDLMSQRPDAEFTCSG